MCGLTSAPQADQPSMLPVISRLNALVWFVDLVNFRRAIEAPVLAADQPLREGVLAGVGGKTGGGHLGGTFAALRLAGSAWAASKVLRPTVPE